ncbi:MAG TPA: DUF3301 domain-containing protein [Candidatus Acidoferrum sp.]|nr:DUF3301 domain-containing protein [Candidatus Acidoferrum sp.]
MYTLSDILLLLPFALAAAWWWRASQQKTVAVTTARDYCRQRGLQFLDDSLVFKKFRLERNLHQQRFLCRVYEFDYSPDGNDRKSGEIVLSGYRVLRVLLQSDVVEITQY